MRFFLSSTTCSRRRKSLKETYSIQLCKFDIFTCDKADRSGQFSSVLTRGSFSQVRKHYPKFHSPLPKVTDKSIYKLILTFLNRNLADKEEVEARTNISFYDLWTVKIMLPGQYCYIFNAPEKIRPSLIIGVRL